MNGDAASQNNDRSRWWTVRLPNTPWPLAMLATALWWTRLKTIPPYFERKLELGYYESDNDAIAIPIAGNAVLTVVGFPVLAGLLWLALRKYPAGSTLFSWSPRRWVASTSWTAMFVGLVVYDASMCVHEASIGLPLNAIVDALWVVVSLWLRAVIVEKVHRRGLELVQATAGSP